MLDRDFDADALAGLRRAVLGCATACGLPEDRAMEVMLAVHELAANAVCHGPGHGRLRMHVTAGTLRCEVSDPGPASRDGRAQDGPGGHGLRPPGAVPWPVRRGHGLWVARRAADHFRVTSGTFGSLITLAFTFPPTAAPALRTRRPGVPADGTGR